MAAPMVIIGDAFHNFLDGVVIGTAVRTSIPLGVSTALAVATHEIPQELGDMAILLHAGYSRRKALVLNLVSGGSAVLGAIFAVFALDWVPQVNQYVLSVAAAGFLYIAMADLIPDLHRGRIDAKTFRQLALAVAGIGTVVGLNTFVPGDIDVRPRDHPLPEAARRSARASGCAPRVPARTEGATVCSSPLVR